MNRETMATLNFTFAVLIFLLAAGLMLFGENGTIPVALLPVGFANLTIGILGRKKAQD